MIENPSYTAIFPMGAYYQGDTISPFTVKIERDSDLAVVVPLSVCAQVKNQFGEVVHDYDAKIDPSGLISIPCVKADWRPGDYSLGVKYTLAGGFERTYVMGDLTIIKAPTKC